jgi:hypothetical protein
VKDFAEILLEFLVIYMAWDWRKFHVNQIAEIESGQNFESDEVQEE